MLRGLTTVNFWAADMAAAKKWYTELLGFGPYFERPPGVEPPQYAEWRLGDYQHELGLIDRKYSPAGSAKGPGGVVVYWHVDDVAAMFEKLLSMGAKDVPAAHKPRRGVYYRCGDRPVREHPGDHVQPALSGGSALQQKSVTIATGYERRKRAECCGGRRGWRIPRML